MRRLIAGILLMVGGILMVLPLSFKQSIKPVSAIDADTYARDRVLLLQGAKGLCSAAEVKAPSGAQYTLSAAHCIAIIENGRVDAITEDGHIYSLVVVSVDKKADLLLLSPIPKMPAFDIAEMSYMHQHVHTMTHGGGFPSYRTDGEMLSEKDMLAPIAPIMSQADKDECLSKPNQRVEEDICILALHSMVTTAKVIPGSSGGPLIDNNNKLIGIASATNVETGLSFFVTIQDIQAFLKKR